MCVRIPDVAMHWLPVGRCHCEQVAGVLMSMRIPEVAVHWLPVGRCYCEQVTIEEVEEMVFQLVGSQWADQQFSS